MTTRGTSMADDVREYLLAVSSREPDVMARLRAATAPRPESEMQIGPEQGQLLALLVQLPQHALPPEWNPATVSAQEAP